MLGSMRLRIAMPRLKGVMQCRPQALPNRRLMLASKCRRRGAHQQGMVLIGEEYKADPIKDMIPLCPNCHAIFHLSDPPHTIDEVKAFLRREH